VNPPASSPGGGRLVALDAFRGLTIILMIVVNNPGSWGHVYAPLRHAAWHGLTPTDLVFPFFLFITGAAMALSFARRRGAGADRATLLRGIARRAAIIFACGLLLNGFPFGVPLNRDAAAGWSPAAFGDAFAHLRVMGVLQRIALAWGTVALLVVVLPGARRRWAAAGGFVLAYELVTRLLPGAAPGDPFSLAGSAARRLDLAVFGADHVWRVDGLPFEPEGLLTTLTAIVTVMLGYEAGRLLAGNAPLAVRLRRLTGAGVAAVAVGAALAAAEPVNKQLWTVSYTVLTAGLGALVLAACLGAVDARGWRRWTGPLVVFGVNPLVAFLGSGLLARVLGLVRVPAAEGATRSLHAAVYHGVCVPIAGVTGGSLLYALLNVAVWWCVLLGLERRGLRIRV